ncbi:MAG TPA: preprotein translocase subunit SecE [Clostridia bacterium]|nr:preprotein translocase subunit SecE [Clostridia bacterium]
MAEVVKTRKKSKLADHLSKSWSELKKVSWPTFSTVVKNTGVVLVVVLFFLIVIGASDAFFGWLLQLVR